MLKTIKYCNYKNRVYNMAAKISRPNLTKLKKLGLLFSGSKKFFLLFLCSLTQKVIPHNLFCVFNFCQKLDFIHPIKIMKKKLFIIKK